MKRTGRGGAPSVFERVGSNPISRERRAGGLAEARRMQLASDKTLHFSGPGNPLYAVQALTEERPSDFTPDKILLGTQLATIAVFSGRMDLRGIKVRCISDRAGGMTMKALNQTPNIPHEVFGHVAGDTREIFLARSGPALEFMVKEAEDEDCAEAELASEEEIWGGYPLVATPLSAGAQTLFVTRLGIERAFSELNGAPTTPWLAEQNHHPIVLLDVDFAQFCQSISANLNAALFRMIGAASGGLPR